MKIPKRLPLDRSCFYQLPADLSQKERVEHELEFRKQYGVLFHSRSETYFFFELPHALARDAFLQSMEISAIEIGLRVERRTIYPVSHAQTPVEAETRSSHENLRRLDYAAPDADIPVAATAPDSPDPPATRRSAGRPKSTASARRARPAQLPA